MVDSAGLRNAAGMVLEANGDLYLQDNGADLGRLIPDFGFPHTVVSAATGETISAGVAVCPAICATPGAANLENPVVFADPRSGSRFHFIANQLLGHPNGLLASQDSLYLTDLDYVGNLQSDSRGSIYRIQSLVPPPATVPAPLPLVGFGAALGWSRRLRRRQRSSRAPAHHGERPGA